MRRRLPGGEFRRYGECWRRLRRGIPHNLLVDVLRPYQQRHPRDLGRDLPEQLEFLSGIAREPNGSPDVSAANDGTVLPLAEAAGSASGVSGFSSQFVDPGL